MAIRDKAVGMNDNARGQGLKFSAMRDQYCLNCGMHLDVQARRCPKCDNELDQQTDGSTVTIDIAHNGERVHEALRKLRDRIDEMKQGVAQYLRLVVGSGAIKEETLAVLHELERRKVIVRYEIEPRNQGAILVKLKA